MKAALRTIVLQRNNHLSLSGYYYRKEGNTGFYDDITINVCLIENHKQQTVIISMDSIGIDSETTNTIRKHLNKTCSINESNVFLYATHTHSSYKAMRKQSTPLLNVILNDQPHNSFEETFYNNMIQLVVKTVEACQQELVECEISYIKSKVDSVATNRNNKDGFFDNSLDVIKISQQNHIIGCLCIFACHPTVLSSSNMKASSDFIGSIRQTVQQEYPDCTTLYIQGCAAEISTRFTRQESSYQECQRIGGLIGKEVVNCLQQKTQVVANLSTKVLPIQFEVRDFKNRFESINDVQEARVIEVIKQGESFQDLFCQSKTSEVIDSEVSVIDFATFRLCNLPGEPFGEIGRDIKKTMGENTIVCGYCNDYVGYLVSNEGLKQNSYEKYMMLFKEDTHDLIVQTFKLG